ncbi:hypothetical protein QZH41_015848 [Actinostola sp. cb2023]|nr:hypothetical protein QZH41_015848 [Actinostola sp. cb2023]
MIRHAIYVVGQTVRFLNPGQVSILDCDQPKKSPKKSNGTGHRRMVRKSLWLCSGVFTELAALKAIGNWIEDSGWTNALVQAEVTNPGTADSFLKASHVSCTRHAHQIWHQIRYTATISLGRAQIPSVEALLHDGAAIANMLKPGPSRTFEEYSQGVFLPYVKSQLKNVQRVDVVWDMYITDSLEETTRNKRGKGIRRRVKPDTKIPGNWAAFLRVDENKEELFHYLADQLGTIGAEHGQVISTKGEAVVCIGRYG